MAADPREGDLGRLLHDVAELAGHLEPGLAVHGRRLDQQHIAAGTGHGQTGGHPRHRHPVGQVLGVEAGPAQQVGQVGFVDDDRRGGPVGDPHGHLAEGLAQLALELAHPGLAGVAGDGPVQGGVGDLHLAVAQPVVPDLAGEQVVPGDGDLLVLGVAVDPDDLEAVEQRPGHGLEDVGGGDEQHVGQVQVDLEVVVPERVVLGGVEHLEQGGGGVAPEVTAQLVDLVEEDDGVHGPRLGDGLDQPAGLGADVGAPVAPDLGLVPHATQGDPHEAPPEGAGHGLAEGGLADAGRPDQGDDGARPPAGGARLVHASLGPQLAHGQELDDPLLDLVEARVVGVEDLAGRGHVELIRGALGPGQAEDRVEPALDPAPLHVLFGHALEAPELLAEGPDDLVGHPTGLEGVDAGRVVRRGVTVVVLAQLLADGVHLPAEQVLALLLVDAVPHVGADLLDQLELGQGLPGPVEDQPHAAGHLDGLEQLDPALGGQLRPPADQVSQAAGVIGVDAPQDAPHLTVAELLEQRPQGGPELGAEGLGLVGRRALHDGLGGHPQPGSRAHHAGAQPGPSRGAHDQGLGASRQGPGGLQLGDGPHRGEPVAHLGHEQELPAVVGGGRGGGARLLGLGGDGHHHAGQDHAVGKRQRGVGVGIHGVGHAGLHSGSLATCKSQQWRPGADSRDRCVARLSR